MRSVALAEILALHASNTIWIWRDIWVLHASNTIWIWRDIEDQYMTCWENALTSQSWFHYPSEVDSCVRHLLLMQEIVRNESQYTTSKFHDSTSVTQIYLRIRIMYGSIRMWGTFYLCWKSRGGNVVQSTNRTDVESCANGLRQSPTATFSVLFFNGFRHITVTNFWLKSENFFFFFLVKTP